MAIIYPIRTWFPIETSHRNQRTRLGKDQTMSKILVIGATGNVGRPLV